MDGNISSAGESNQGAPGKVMRPGRLWLIVAVLVVVGLFFFWPLVFHVKHLVPFNVLAGDPAFEGIDMTSDRPDWRTFDGSPITIFYAEKTLAARELHRGELPLWNPYNAVGVPLLANGQSQPFAPFFLPFMVHPTPWTYSWVLLLQILFGGFGAALLLRKLGTGLPAQIFAGLLFAFNPYAMNYLPYSNAWAYVWFPWVFLSAEKWVKRERSGVLTAILIALMAMSGHVEVAFFGATSVFVYLAVRFSQEGLWRKNRWRWITLPLFTACLSAWWLLPFIEYAKNCTSSRFGGNICYPYHPSACFVVGSELFWQPVFLFLAVVGLLAPGRRRFGLALLPGFAWSLVMMFPFPMVLQKLATLNLLSGRYGRSVVWFVLIVCAGLGLDALEKKGAPRWVLSVATVILLTWLGLGLVVQTPSSAVADARHWVPLQGRTLVHFTWIIVLNLLALLLVLIPRRWWSARRLAASLALLTLAGTLFFHSYFNVYWNKSQPGLAPAVRARAAPKEGRSWFPNKGMWQSLSPNLGLLFELKDARYNDPLYPRRLALLNELSGGKSLLVGAGVTPVIERWNGPGADFMEVTLAWFLKDADRGNKSELVPVVNAKPEGEALWCDSARVVSGGREAFIRALRNRAWTRTVFLEKASSPIVTPAQFSGTDRASIRLVARTSLRSTWNVSAHRSGWFLLRNLYWPGWRAVIDGRVTRVYPADGVFMAVYVDRGIHEVAFLYRPESVVLGCGISLLVLIGCIWIWIKERKEQVEGNGLR